MKPKCIDNHNKHTGDYFKIISSDGDDMSQRVVRWCSVCGAVVVDLEYDGRLKPGHYMCLMFPELLTGTEKQELLNKINN